MSNTEWNERRPGAYSVWGENMNLYYTLGEYDEEEEEYVEMEEEYEDMEEEDSLSPYEEILADSIVRDASLTDNAMRLSVSVPTLTLTEGVPVTFKYSDKATTIQEIADGQLSLTVKENTGLQSIKIHANNRTWTIPLDTFPTLPPLIPKKR